MVDCTHQKLRWRNEIGVEHGDELACGSLQPLLESSGLVAMAIGAMPVFHGETKRLIFLHQSFSKLMGLIRGIVQNLYLQQMLRIIHFRGFVDQPFHDEPFVIKRELNRDARQFRKARRCLIHCLFSVLEVGVNHFIPVKAVNRQNEEDAEVRDQHGPIKPACLVNACKRRICEATPELVERATRQKEAKHKLNYNAALNFRFDVATEIPFASV